ncbi:MAG: ABC transporter ATP-binding protein [Jaaginema sp. PMC 1079.18]|nr:ABC transporter ATP-binding protein [Jaaginema sp. PMC 1080.18]MEC4852979.1 ABC transporter ATP-binding protein [Jaaginema sp. PMC 1079.18]MEC4867506.1 ABC transporter ATP-binding protein [Jaaginema sp. PMC 1078.18]
MPETVIQVENLGKKYVIGRQQSQNLGLRHVLDRGLRSLLRFQPGQKTVSPKTEEFWALQEINFTVQQGDRVGIIGRNGAGKSTLLKLLSRITDPTTGRISLKGRVASLLEVGTGFHPELTGRENIYLNGAILGMSRVEIQRKFDEIVAFAEVEKFLDTPVKRYSSGMYVRLAFAVAAHLEPEILVVDEVLAVGDAQFQKKCLGKMEDVGKEGRTVIFVSHQMGMISQLCSRAFLLNRGQIVGSGSPLEMINLYMSDLTSGDNNIWRRDRTQLSKSTSEIYINQATTSNSPGQVTSEFGHDDAITLNLHLQIDQWCEDAIISVAVKNSKGYKIFTTERSIQELNPNATEFTVNVKIPELLLTPGQYSCLVAVHIRNVRILDLIDDLCVFTITDLGSEFAFYEGLDYGCIFVDCDWYLTQLAPLK